MCEICCNLNWLAILICFIIGQLASTIWFTALFGDKWAKIYGVQTKQEHMSQIPLRSYFTGAVCTFLLVLGISILQKFIGVENLKEGILLGVLIILCFCIPSILPGQEFLKRRSVFYLSCGSQSLIILITSILLSIWR